MPECHIPHISNNNNLTWSRMDAVPMGTLVVWVWVWICLNSLIPARTYQHLNTFQFYGQWKFESNVYIYGNYIGHKLVQKTIKPINRIWHFNSKYLWIDCVSSRTVNGRACVLSVHLRRDILWTPWCARAGWSPADTSLIINQIVDLLVILNTLWLPTQRAPHTLSLTHDARRPVRRQWIVTIFGRFGSCLKFMEKLDCGTRAKIDLHSNGRMENRIISMRFAFNGVGAMWVAVASVLNVIPEFRFGQIETWNINLS